MIALLLTGWASAQSLQIQIADPAVSSVHLVCPGGNLDAPVIDGVAQLERSPNDCVVHLLRRVGLIDAPGVWACDLGGCEQRDIDHRPVTNVDGRINVIVEAEATFTSLELVCPGGYRTRSAIHQSVAVFDDVPDAECTLMFKGGVPAKYRPIRWGTHQCRLSGSIAVCAPR